MSMINVGVVGGSLQRIIFIISYVFSFTWKKLIWVRIGPCALRSSSLVWTSTFECLPGLTNSTRTSSASSRWVMILSHMSVQKKIIVLSYFMFITIGGGAHKFTFRRAATCGNVLSLKQYKVYCGWHQRTLWVGCILWINTMHENG